MIGIRISPSRMAQFLIFILFQFTFGLTMGATFTVLTAPTASILHAYITQLNTKFPGRSTVNRRMAQIYSGCKTRIDPFIAEFQDFFFCTLGDRARTVFRIQFQEANKKITPMPECFIGIAPASRLFPHLNVHTRGELLPYLHTLLYAKAKRISSVMELVGDLKTPEWNDNVFLFQLAGTLGFIAGPPGKHKFYQNLFRVEQNLENLNVFLDEVLITHGVHDLTVTTVDSSTIIVDKRDTTGSIGTGSRGTFFGHKTSIGAGANCLPVTNTFGSGRVHDTTLFPETFQPMVALAQKTGQEIWICEADAGYCHDRVINMIEQAETIPMVDLNPKNSHLLQQLKDATRNLTDVSKKAIKTGLSLEERRNWIGEIRALSDQSDLFIPLEEKKKS